MSRTFKEHLDPELAPKRILSLDGGGIRGALTLGYLSRIEAILQSKYGPDYRLCDHFDLIGGTSTGSIIAAALAIGKPVEEIKDLYMDLGEKIFGNKRRLWNPLEAFAYLKAKYNYKALENSLKKAFGNILIGDDEIKTGLCIVAKRADTNSTWPIINHPGGKYYSQNCNIPLWQAVRASSAAPTYFAPQKVDVGNGEIGAFVDGGLSMANNPALRLLMVATLKGFPFHWSMKEDKLSIVSVGTGYGIYAKQIGEIEDLWLKTWAEEAPNMLMQDASWLNQIMLQWLSNSPTAVEIDSEIESLNGDYISGTPLIKYLRYNFKITENDLNGLKLGRHFTSADVEDILEMSNAHNRHLLYEIGKAHANTILESDILCI